MIQRFAAALFLLLAWGCGMRSGPGDAARPAPDVVQDSADAVAVVGGLSGPEAVRYDAEQDVHFVANWAGRDPARDGDGFISRVGPDGTVRELRFMTGTAAYPLHMPRGMTLQADTLWAADVDGVHAFDRRTGRQLGFVDFRALEPGFLNDVALDEGGTLYVTDTGRSRVYRVRAGRPEVAVQDLPASPNGIAWDPRRRQFLLAPWQGDSVLRAWDPATGALTAVATLPAGRVDGLEVVGDRVLLAVQEDSSLYALEDGAVRRIVRVPGRPADIGVDTRRGRVAVPYIALDRVELYALPR